MSVGVHAAAAGSLILTIAWVYGFSEMGPGLGFTGARLFNWHPILMMLAYGVFMTEGVVAFKLSANVKRSSLKNFHKYSFMASGLCSVVGLIAVVKHHDNIRVPHFYSVHSWVGLAVFFISWIQLAVGGLLYATNILSADTKRFMMGYHKATGKFLYTSSVAAMVTGIMQKQSFLRNVAGNFDWVNIMGNIIAVLLLVKLASVLLEYEVVSKPALTKMVSGDPNVSMETLPTVTKPGLTMRSPQS